ncbi:MAG: FHA domain-containing protein [Nannocystaceae bacterium]|nr:FHA domain-containing protein [Nannocystaceae bacterium]
MKGPTAGALLEIRHRMVAGRDPSCDIVLGEAGISREHAIFQDDGETLSVSDVASTNGTFVNGTQISQPAALQEGDVVTMGGCELEFVGRKPQSEFPSYRDTRENIPLEPAEDAGRYAARKGSAGSTGKFKKLGKLVR